MKKTLIINIVLIMLLFGLLAIVVYLALPHENNSAMPHYEMDADIVSEFDPTAFTEFDILEREIYNRESFDNESLNFDSANSHVKYIVKDLIVSLGDTVTKGVTKVGKLADADVYSSVNGRVLDIKFTEDRYEITVLNADSFYITISVPQNKVDDITYQTIFVGFLPDGNQFNLKVKKIYYEIEFGYMRVDLIPQTTNYNVLPGMQINVVLNKEKNDCKYYISLDAFYVRNQNTFKEDTYYTFVEKKYDNVKQKYVYDEIRVRTGRKLGDLVAIYVNSADITLLVKLI